MKKSDAGLTLTRRSASNAVQSSRAPTLKTSAGMKVNDRKGRGRLVEVGTHCGSCEQATDTVRFSDHDEDRPEYVCSECGQEKIPVDPKKSRKQIRKRGAIVWGILFGGGFLVCLFLILIVLLTLRGVLWALAQ